MTVYEGISSFNDSTAQLNLAVLRTSEEIEAAGTAWQALERDCMAHLAYFQTFDWCSNWVRHIAPNVPGCEPHVVSIWQESALVAVVPLMQSRLAGGVRVLSALGDPHTQYAGMLLAPDACSASVTAMIRSYLEAPQDCDALYVELLPVDSPLAAMLNPADRETAYVNQSSSLDLT
jgi:CelD/BcsL family acetyltransferase involved in cellulose biosynthesis